jgi:DNA-binding response OmpR family regulator
MNKILLVEDEALMINLYQNLLTTKGFEVDTALDGNECMEKLKSGTYDLLLLDIMMPNKDGLLTLKEVRADEKLKNLPIIIMSNLGNENVISDAYAMGVSHYFVKSDTENDEIIKTINEVLSGKK